MWKVLFICALFASVSGVYVAHPEKRCEASQVQGMVRILSADKSPFCLKGHVGAAKATPEICDCFAADGVKIRQKLGKLPDCHLGFAGKDVHLEDLFNKDKCKDIVAKQHPEGAVPKKLTVLNPWAPEREQVMVPQGYEYPAAVQAHIHTFKDIAIGTELESFWDVVARLTCDCLGCVWFWGSQSWKPCNCIDGISAVVKAMYEYVVGQLMKAIEWVFDNISFLRAAKEKIQGFIEDKFGKPIKDCQTETGFSLNKVTERFNSMCSSGNIDLGKVFSGSDKFFSCMKKKAFGAAELARLEEEMKTMITWDEQLAAQQEAVQAFADADAMALQDDKRRLSQTDHCGKKHSFCQSGVNNFFQDPTLVFTLGFTMSGSKATINVKFGLQTGRLAVTFGLVTGLSGKTYQNAYTLIMEKLGRELPVFSGFEVQFFRKFSFNKEGAIPMINLPLGDMLPAPVGPFIKVIIKGGIVRLSLLRTKACEDNKIDLGGGCRLTFAGLAITPNIPFLSGAAPAAPPPTLIMPVWSTTIIEFYTGLIKKNGKQCGHGIGGALCGGAKTTPYAPLTAFTTEEEADTAMLTHLENYKMQVSRARAVEDYFISKMEEEQVQPARNAQENMVYYGAAAGAAIFVIGGGLLVRSLRGRSDDDYQSLLEV